MWHEKWCSSHSPLAYENCSVCTCVHVCQCLRQCPPRYICALWVCRCILLFMCVLLQCVRVCVCVVCGVVCVCVCLHNVCVSQTDSGFRHWLTCRRNSSVLCFVPAHCIIHWYHNTTYYEGSLWDISYTSCAVLHAYIDIYQYIHIVYRYIGLYSQMLKHMLNHHFLWLYVEVLCNRYVCIQSVLQKPAVHTVCTLHKHTFAYHITPHHLFVTTMYSIRADDPSIHPIS
jgi:hypothetical protein